MNYQPPGELVRPTLAFRAELIAVGVERRRQYRRLFCERRHVAALGRGDLPTREQAAHRLLRRRRHVDSLRRRQPDQRLDANRAAYLARWGWNPWRVARYEAWYGGYRARLDARWTAPGRLARAPDRWDDRRDDRGGGHRDR